MGDVEVVQTVHQDGTVDYVDTHAVGGDLAQMPEGYYRSIQFVGTVIVSLLLSNEWGSREKDADIWAGCLLCEYLRIPGMGSTCQYSVSRSHLGN
jgi:hypothetical protein